MSTLKISEAGTVQFPMVKHAVENVLPLGYKAFVVAVNREACVMKNG